MTAVVRESVYVCVCVRVCGATDRRVEIDKLIAIHTQKTQQALRNCPNRVGGRVKERETGTETKASRQYEYLSQSLSVAGIPCKGGSRG